MSALFEGIFIAVCLLIWTEICSSQSFQINRIASKDYFTIPSTECSPNDCSALYNAKKGKHGTTDCECVCDSTFSFHKELNWTCIKNARKTRNLFGKLFNLLLIRKVLDHFEIPRVFTTSCQIYFAFLCLVLGNDYVYCWMLMVKT